MTEIEKLKKIQNIRNRMIDLYDEFRFDHQNIKYDIFKTVKEIKEDLDIMAANYISDMSGVQEIVVMEDAIIEPGQTYELRTNITSLKTNEDEIEINFEGYIPTSGYLKLTSKNSEIGLRIYVNNTVPRSIFEEYKDGYHYCYPTSTKFFAAGVYRIEKGTVIGLAIAKYDNKEKQYKHIHDRFNKVN